MKNLITSYNHLPISFKRGQGIWLWDEHDNAYLDAFAGIAVCGLGHAHPQVSEAICEQAKTLVHTSNIYQINHQTQLAHQLTELTGMKQAFFANSGAEANEAAIKIARLYGHHKGMVNPTIIVMENAFHGRTMATLSASGTRKVQAGFEPLVPGFVRAPYDDIEALKTVADNSDDVVAIMLEPIQGEGGIHIPHDEYLAQVHQLCQQNDWLMILDEVQTGMGRTGKLFAFQHSEIQPDVVTAAKALANGVPIGACLMGGKAIDILQPGRHGSTFGGNPLACRAALAVLEVIEQQQLIKNAVEMGAYLVKSLQERFAELAQVVDIRGKGLMIGIELEQPCAHLVNVALKNRLLINVTADKVIRLLPPINLKRDEADLIVEKLHHSLVEYIEQLEDAVVSTP